MSKKKAMTSEKARFVRQKGHLDALEFALSIGLSSDYQNNPIAKKDVIDFNGDTHSVKSGTKRWQIFLYSKHRFENDPDFQTMNGIGQLFIKCLDVFPENYYEYKSNKTFYKNQLRPLMVELRNLLSEKRRLRSFLYKSMFNGGEVDYLTVKFQDKFHIFLNKDILKILTENIDVTNSRAIKKDDTPEQKVLLIYNGLNLGEIEIRNSSPNHYKEVLFVMNKLRVLSLIFEKLEKKINFNDKVIVYESAIKKFTKNKRLFKN